LLLVSIANGFEQPRLEVIVVSSISFFSSMSSFDPDDCYVHSSYHRLDYHSNLIVVEGGWLLHLPAQSPITPKQQLWRVAGLFDGREAITVTGAVRLGQAEVTNLEEWKK
jgi:hypothetical protein